MDSSIDEIIIHIFIFSPLGTELDELFEFTYQMDGGVDEWLR